MSEQEIPIKIIVQDNGSFCDTLCPFFENYTTISGHEYINCLLWRDSLKRVQENKYNTGEIIRADRCFRLTSD